MSETKILVMRRVRGDKVLVSVADNKICEIIIHETKSKNCVIIFKATTEVKIEVEKQRGQNV